MSKWRALVLVLVHVAIALHMLHWYTEGETLSPLEPSEAMEYSKNSVINAGLVFFAVSGLLTLVFGRFFCGWGCHLVAVQDLCYWMMKRIGIRPKAMHARLLLLVPFCAFFYMFLFPPLYRWWTGMGFEETTLELSTTGFWDTFPPWPIALATLAVAGFSIIYFLGAKGFCTYACPYGALYGTLDRFSPGRIRVTDACKGCGHCTQVCTSDVVVHAEVKEFGKVVDPSCMKCLDCVSVCPEDALYFGFGKWGFAAKKRPETKLTSPWSWWRPARWSTYSWTEELVLVLLFAGAVATFRGLYDSIPFLFSLGIAGIVSFCTLQFLQLFYRPRVKLQQLELKTGGKVTSAGHVFAGLAILMLAVQAHSVVVKYHRNSVQASYDELRPIINAVLSAPSVLSDEQRAEADSAIAHIETLYAIAPIESFRREDWRLAQRSAWLHLLLGDEESFRHELTRASTILPHEPMPFSGLANYHAAAGRQDEATSWFERATQAAPELASGWLEQAAWYASTGRQSKAIEGLQSGTEAAEEPGRLWLELAKYAREAGDEAKTLSAFEQALKADSKLLEARYLYGGFLYELGRRSECADQYELLLLETPDDVHLRLQTTLLCMELERWKRAEEHALAARDAAPEAPEPWVALSQLARARGDEAEADRLFAEAEKRAAGPAR